MQRILQKYLTPYFFSALMLALLWPCAAFGVEALFKLDSPQTAPFPSDRFTVADSQQITNRRVNLPKPDCSVNISECREIDILNELDGFNIQPRLSIPFSGPIDLSTVSSKTIFLVPIYECETQGRLRPVRIGINQIVWDQKSNTLYAESDQLLQEHTRYVLFVTSGVRDVDGNPVKPSPEFLNFLARSIGTDALTDYRENVRKVVKFLDRFTWFTGRKVIAASVFTTMSITPILKKMREQIRAAPAPAQANFLLGPGGSRTVFSASPVSIDLYRQTTTTTRVGAFPAAPDYDVQHWYMNNPSHTIAFGRFHAPNFLTKERYIPQVATDSGMPQIRGKGYDILFILHLPAGTPPEGGWPVAIFGHGRKSNMLLSCWLHHEFTSQGIAVVAFNAIGHGGGPRSILKVSTATEEIEIPGVGRSEDRNKDGDIDWDEGISAEGLYSPIIVRDGVRQTAAELMQLVRVIEVGVDVNGVGRRDLDPTKIYYFGHSLGGMYGTLFLAVEPAVSVGVLVAPATQVHGRLSPVFRPMIAEILGQRVPSLLNAGADFNENIPLRDQPPVVNTVAGAMELQEFFERQEWMWQPGVSTAYAPHLLPDNKILVQFVMGDRASPNLSISAMLRAGRLVKYATYLRWDIMLQINPEVSWDPHDFICNMPESREQIAKFFETEGTTIVDPDGRGQLWETPIVPPLPEDINYFP